MRTRNLLLTASAGALFAAATVMSVVALTTSTKPLPTNPEAGMTDAQRMNFERSSTVQWRQQYASWLATVNIPKETLPSLSETTLLAEYAVGAPSLPAAVKNSNFILGLTGERVDFAPAGNSVVTAGVDRSILGGYATPTVDIYESGGLRPTEDWKGMFLAEAENAPLILPGDQVIVFLQKTARGALEIQSFTGFYRVHNGLVTALDGNPFKSSVDGQTVEAFTAAILAARLP